MPFRLWCGLATHGHEVQELDRRYVRIVLKSGRSSRPATGIVALIVLLFMAPTAGGMKAECRFSRRFGVEFGVLQASSVDGSCGIFGGTTGGSVEVSEWTPVGLGCGGHVTPDRPIDVSVGPLLALVPYRDVEIRTTFSG